MTNTRSAAGRADLDSRIAGLLSTSPVAIEALVSATGATILQVRSSLRRLIAAGRAQKTGQTRATRYTAATPDSE